ncbi:MAG: biopolymer transporter Tol, partial [Planctomycetes bacterium]|nr:biopolymer transporter Tol [Planctomycetota bacterium]
VDNAVTQLTNNSYNDYSPKISANGYVTWCGDENSNENFCGDPLRSDSEIFLYDKTNIMRLTDNHYEDIDPQINANGQVVWCGHDGADWEIFFYDGITVARLTNNSRQDLGPQINDSGHVVWYGNGEIFFYDGTDITRLGNNSTDLNPRINGKGHIVWQHYDGHDYEIFLYNGSTGARLTDNSFDDLHPRINDSGHVVWYGDARVFVYDGS